MVLIDNNKSTPFAIKIWAKSGRFKASQLLEAMLRMNKLPGKLFHATITVY